MSCFFFGLVPARISGWPRTHLETQQDTCTFSREKKQDDDNGHPYFRKRKTVCHCQISMLVACLQQFLHTVFTQYSHKIHIKFIRNSHKNHTKFTARQSKIHIKFTMYSRKKQNSHGIHRKFTRNSHGTRRNSFRIHMKFTRNSHSFHTIFTRGGCKL